MKKWEHITHNHELSVIFQFYDELIPEFITKRLKVFDRLILYFEKYLNQLSHEVDANCGYFWSNHRIFQYNVF